MFSFDEDINGAMNDAGMFSDTQSSSDETTQTDQGTVATANSGSSDAGDTSNSNNEQQLAGAEPTNKGNEQQQSQHKELIDPETGEAVPDGAPKRLYFKAERLKAQLSEAQRAVMQHQTELVALREANQAYKEMTKQFGEGVTHEDLKASMAFIKGMQSDPKATINNLLTTLEQHGIKVLDEGASNNLTQMKMLIDQAIKDNFGDLVIQQKLSKQQQEQEAQLNRIYEQMDQFVPHASVHRHEIEAFIAHRMQQGASITPAQAYSEIKNYYERNGFDFSKPVNPEDIKKKRESVTAQQTSGAVNNPPPNLPNGGRVNQQTLQTTASVVQSNSIADAIRESMLAAGITF